MLDKDKICKRKYIYRSYKSDDGTFHCERYPIAYQNRNYVYYVTGSGHMLGVVGSNMVIETMGSAIQRNIDRGREATYGINNSYFWNVSSDDMKLLRDWAKKLREDHIQKALKYAKSECERLEQELKQARARMKLILDQCEEAANE